MAEVLVEVTGLEEVMAEAQETATLAMMKTMETPIIMQNCGLLRKQQDYDQEKKEALQYISFLPGAILNT